MLFKLNFALSRVVAAFIVKTPIRNNKSARLLQYII